MKYEYIKNFKDNEKTRQAFNQLTRETFGFDFESWYTGGFWQDQYMPHSLMDGELMVANVSANMMIFEGSSGIKKYIQIGTVMTHEDYRGQGLSRWLMETVLETYHEKVDGFYLFGNDEVLDFYPKFGFKDAYEYSYSRPILERRTNDFESMAACGPEAVAKYLDYIENSIANHDLYLHNYGLQTFWTSHMSDVYYSKSLDTYVVACIEDKKLLLNSIIGIKPVALDHIINSFGHVAKEVTLGFTPLDKSGFTSEKYRKEDCTFFYLGNELERVQNDQLRFPLYSHA